MALRPEDPKSPDKQLAAQQDVFVREVDDALREDEMMGAFKRFGIPIGAALVLGLAALGGYLWWDSSQMAASDRRGEQFTVALDKVEHGHLDAGDKDLAVLAKDSSAGTRAAAMLLRAGIALEKGQRDQAAKLFAEVAADSAAPQPFRDLAMIRDVAVRFDALPPQQVVDRLKTLAVPGNAWFGNAGELVGIAYLKQGKPELAGPLFASIARDKDAPESLRGRARQLAGLLGVDAVDDIEKAASGESALAQ